LPIDPTLAQVFATWDAAGHFVQAWDDRQWRVVGNSKEVRASNAGDFVIGEFKFGHANVEATREGMGGWSSIAALSGSPAGNLPSGPSPGRGRGDLRLRCVSHDDWAENVGESE